MCIFNKYDFADSVRYTVEIALTDLKLAPALIEATGNKTDKVVQKEQHKQEVKEVEQTNLVHRK